MSNNSNNIQNKNNIVALYVKYTLYVGMYEYVHTYVQ